MSVSGDVGATGIAQVRSRFSVAETAERLLAALAAKGITLFALIDHSGEAAKPWVCVMPETKLLVFGSPKAGTPVMLAAPTSALDLPLKILVPRRKLVRSWWWSTTAAGWLAGRHGVPGDLVPVLAGGGGSGAGGWVGGWLGMRFVAEWRKAVWSLRLRLCSGLRQQGAHSCAMKPAHEWAPGRFAATASVFFSCSLTVENSSRINQFVRSSTLAPNYLELAPESNCYSSRTKAGGGVPESESEYLALLRKKAKCPNCRSSIDPGTAVVRGPGSFCSLDCVAFYHQLEFRERLRRLAAASAN